MKPLFHNISHVHPFLSIPSIALLDWHLFIQPDNMKKTVDLSF